VLFFTYSVLPRTSLKLSAIGRVHTLSDALQGLSKAEKLALVLPIILIIRYWMITSFIIFMIALPSLQKPQSGGTVERWGRSQLPLESS